MQVIGLTRFSYPAIGGFQVEHASIEDRISYLFDPDRIEARFRSFEAMTLPPLRAQTDPDFTLLVVIGAAMPSGLRDRLMALVADMPQVVVQALPPRRHRQAMQEAINSVRRAGRDPCLQFRMDDDDAVACTYVERLREAALDLRKLSRRHRHLAIDFNQGYIVRPGPGGIEAAPTNRPLTTAALAVMFQPRVALSIMNFAHQKLARTMPVVSFTGEDMLLRGHDDWNDSRQKPGVKPLDLRPLTADQAARFRSTFNIDDDHVKRVYRSADTARSR